MNTETMKYVFWVLTALPILILGVFLFMSLTKSVYNRYVEDQKKKQAEAQEEKKRQSFEETYSRRRSGGK